MGSGTASQTLPRWADRYQPELPAALLTETARSGRRRRLGQDGGSLLPLGCQTSMGVGEWMGV